MVSDKAYNNVRERATVLSVLAYFLATDQCITTPGTTSLPVLNAPHVFKGPIRPFPLPFLLYPAHAPSPPAHPSLAGKKGILAAFAVHGL